MSEIIESTSVEIEPAPDHTLFEVRDPVDRLEAAKRVAAALKTEIENAGMVVRIGGSEHVRVEGWQTLATMAGLTTRIAWSRPIDGGWEARAEVVTADGRVISTGESMCTRAERNWARKDEFTIRSMAQTRAASRALRMTLAFVMTLSGHDATPVEEVIDTQTTEPALVELPAWAKPVSDVGPTANALVAILKAIGTPDPVSAANAIGQAIFDRCDKTVPALALALLEDIVDVTVVAS